MSNTSYTIEYLESVRAELDEVYNYIKPEMMQLSEYFLPRSARFDANDKDKLRKKAKKIKDSTVYRAVRNYSSGLMTSASSPATNWFNVKVKNYKVDYDKDALDWCGNVTELMNNILSSSNFYQSIPLVYRHLGVFGFGCLYCEHDYDNVVNFSVIPMGSYRYAKNSQGKIDTFIRLYKESVKNLIDQFGEDNVSERVKSLVKNKKLNEQIEVCHYVAPNKEYLPNATFAKNKKFVSIYYETNADKATNKILHVSGYDKFPYVVYESEVTGSDTYPSNSSGIEALPDARQLMEMVEDEAKGIKKIVSPAYQGPQKLKSQAKDSAGSYIAVPEDSRQNIQPIYAVPAQFMNIHDLIELKKTDIENAFYNDLFSIILNTQKSGRTAFEVNELKEEKLSLLAPLLNQVHSGHKDVFEWLFEEIQELGICPIPPESIFSKEFDVEFVSTLTQARLATKVSGIERLVTYVANLSAQVQPALRHKIKFDESIDMYAKYGNIDMSLLRSNEEVEKIQQAEQQQAEQQQNQAQLMQGLKDGSEVIKNIGGQDSYGAELLNRLGVG